MKNLKIYYLLMIAVVLSFISCEKDNDNKEDELQIEVLKEMIFEKGESDKTLRLSHSNWVISSIVDKDTNSKIKGKTYSLNDNLLSDGEDLKLDDLGRLESDLSEKGFVITRKEPTLLVINVLENKSGEDFLFSINVLTEGESKPKEFVIRQKVK